MSEQLYTTDTAVERLTRCVAEAVESGGRFTRAEFSVDDVATVLDEWQAATVDRDRWVKLWETASNSVIRLQADIDAPVQQPNRDALGWEYGRKSRATGKVFRLAGPPLPEWFGESQETHIHVRRMAGPWVEVTP